MAWYDALFIIVGIIGIFMILFGSYHGHRTLKTGVVGWIIVIGVLIIRVGIWILSMT